MIQFIVILSIMANIRNVQSQVIFPGPCPKMEAVQNFDVEKYAGLWYEQARYFTIFEIGGTCVTAEYSLNSNATVNVLNKQISPLTGPSSILGIAKFAGSPSEGKLSVRFPTNLIQFDAPYWVVATDYDNYAIVYSCTGLGIVNFKFVWVLTRKRNPSEETLKTVNDSLKELKITKTFLMKTKQDNCSERT